MSDTPPNDPSLVDPVATEPSDRHSLYWVPNVLTIARILSVPLFIAGILSLAFKWDLFLAKAWVLLGLFILAALTDFLDGYLARKWNVVSGFGRMIDPIADKLLVAGCVIAFSIAALGNPIFLIPSLAIVFRDILVSGAREHAALAGRAMPPTKLAKWKTAFEMLAIAILIIWILAKSYLPIDNVIPDIVSMSKATGLTCLWLAAILSVYTGSLYVRAALKE
ncbi:CDP-diacylglycerol--glycerol-3-phosphate 3-phosphatidyltransferase [Litorimonas sp.]|uniref:CDP-diacylglycerol--glycerol-3-phosphate 3-phosphatidyltransferase n=1 Tax=Litorimonas sp. TaxID=1892381 RepID=UPI003A84125A